MVDVFGKLGTSFRFGIKVEVEVEVKIEVEFGIEAGVAFTVVVVVMVVIVVVVVVVTASSSAFSTGCSIFLTMLFLALALRSYILCCALISLYNVGSEARFLYRSLLRMFCFSRYCFEVVTPFYEHY